jgi:TonB family protein
VKSQNDVTATNWAASVHAFGRQRGAILTRRGLLVSGLAGLVRAQTTDEKVYDVGPGITPPRIVKQVNPRYPTNRGVRAVGSVLIALVVSSKGLPKEPRIIKGLDKDLDQSAIDAVKQWRFAPAQKDGKAVAVRISLQIEFHDM